jgi:hypothetical protein
MLAEQELPDLSQLPEVAIEDEWDDGTGGSAAEDPYGYGYWRRADGWITAAQMNYSAVQSQERKGMVSLPQYGKFALNPPLRKNSQGVIIPQWIPRLRPYDRILELGGAHEFPADQVIAHNWHRECLIEVYDYRPDGTWVRRRRRIQFPQLAGRDLTTYPCSTCGRSFNTPGEMKTHRSVAHPEEGTLELVAETNKKLTEAIVSGQRNVESGPLSAVLAQLAALQEQNSRMLAALLQEREPVAPAGRRPRNTTDPAVGGAPVLEPGETEDGPEV